MPRRNPRRPACPPWQRIGRIQRTSVVRGLSRHGQLAIANLERTRYRPGMISFALTWWARFVHSPYHRLYDRRYEGCGFFECCPDPGDVRGILEVTAHALPRKDARVFRRRLTNLDDLW